MYFYAIVQIALYVKKPNLIQIAALVIKITGYLNTSLVSRKVNIFPVCWQIPMAYDFMFPSGSNLTATEYSLLLITAIS